jgi:ubiquinone/menaquinone biosynthesis C-methylase UbiE
LTDSESYIRMLEISNPLLEPVVRAAVKEIHLPSGGKGLDAGCGIGLQARLLAETVGPAGHVTGVDISSDLLRHAEATAQETGMSRRISFQQGDVTRLPFAEDTLDWAWSSCCVGYSAAIEPRAALKELARVVKPGGKVAIFVWSSERLLPGYPLLEARLQATGAGIAPFTRNMPPERHCSRALGWFRAAGLQEIAARTFTGGAHAPLNEDLRSALEALFEMRWPGVESELSEEERAEFRRLCLPESPDFILNHPDYYAFFTCSMFCGTVRC